MSYRLAFDYAGPIDPTSISGVEAVLRYLGGPHALTVDEIAAHHAAGRGVVALFETAADEAEHPERGAGDGAAAQAALDALGWPLDRPCYFTDDHNDNDTAQEVPYMGGVASTFTTRPRGLYANRDVLVACRAAGTIDYGYGVGTWGFGEGPGELPHDDLLVGVAQIVQLANPHDLGQPADAAGDTDVNLILADDYGAWLPPSTLEVSVFPVLVQTLTQIVLIGADGELDGLGPGEADAFITLGVKLQNGTDDDVAKVAAVQRRSAAALDERIRAVVDERLVGRPLVPSSVPLPPGALERRRLRKELRDTTLGAK